MTTRRTTLSTVVLAGLLTLTACGGTSGTAASGSAPAPSSIAIPANATYDAQDVAFARDMRPHHQQAVEMADILLAKNPSAPLRALAEKIRAEQTPEITTLDGLLQSYGATASGSGHGGGDGGSEAAHMTMPGMMSEAEMADFRAAAGAAAERQFLTMMIAHHQGAIDMAQGEIRRGKDAAAIALARSIVTAQQAEIVQMKQLLASR